MTIQIIFKKSEQMFSEFAPTNPYSPKEFSEMLSMLKEAEALGVIRDFAMF